MSKATVTVGTNVREWVTYEIKDATAEEIDTLNQGWEGPEALVLLRQMDENGRLEIVEFQSDENPDYLDESADPAIIGVDTEEV